MSEPWRKDITGWLVSSPVAKSDGAMMPAAVFDEICAGVLSLAEENVALKKKLAAVTRGEASVVVQKKGDTMTKSAIWSEIQRRATASVAKSATVRTPEQQTALFLGTAEGQDLYMRYNAAPNDAPVRKETALQPGVGELEQLAAARRKPGQTPQQAMRDALMTPEGNAMYERYLAANR